MFLAGTFSEENQQIRDYPLLLVITQKIPITAKINPKKQGSAI
jgi:hypothetical protein